MRARRVVSVVSRISPTRRESGCSSIFPDSRLKSLSTGRVNLLHEDLSNPEGSAVKIVEMLPILNIVAASDSDIFSSGHSDLE